LKETHTHAHFVLLRMESCCKIRRSSEHGEINMYRLYSSLRGICLFRFAPPLPPSSLLSSATSSESLSLSLSLSLPLPLSWSRSWTASIYPSHGFCSIKAPNHLIRFSLPNKKFSSFAGSSICSNLFYI